MNSIRNSPWPRNLATRIARSLRGVEQRSYEVALRQRPRAEPAGQQPPDYKDYAPRTEDAEASQQDGSVRRAKDKQPAAEGDKTRQRIKPHAKRQPNVVPRGAEQMQPDDLGHK